jgi:hypothetical protein
MPGALYVIVYVLPDTPLMPTPEKFATPDTIVLVAVPTMLAPRLTVIVTNVVLSVVSIVWSDLSIRTTGCVVKAAPLTAVAADVNKFNPPGVIVCVTLVTPDTA